MSINSDIIRGSRGFLAIKRVLLVAIIAVVGDLFSNRIFLLLS